MLEKLLWQVGDELSLWESMNFWWGEQGGAVITSVPAWGGHSWPVLTGVSEWKWLLLLLEKTFSVLRLKSKKL